MKWRAFRGSVKKQTGWRVVIVIISEIVSCSGYRQVSSSDRSKFQMSVNFKTSPLLRPRNLREHGGRSQHHFTFSHRTSSHTWPFWVLGLLLCSHGGWGSKVSHEWPSCKLAPASSGSSRSQGCFSHRRFLTGSQSLCPSLGISHLSPFPVGHAFSSSVGLLPQPPSLQQPPRHYVISTLQMFPLAGSLLKMPKPGSLSWEAHEPPGTQELRACKPFRTRSSLLFGLPQEPATDRLSLDF